jgi:hypothetical protein
LVSPTDASVQWRRQCGDNGRKVAVSALLLPIESRPTASPPEIASIAARHCLRLESDIRDADACRGNFTASEAAPPFIALASVDSHNEGVSIYSS